MSILGYMPTFPWGNFFNKNNEVSSSESLDDDNTQYTSLEEDNKGITRENRSSGDPTSSDINRPVQSQKQARNLKFRI